MMKSVLYTEIFQTESYDKFTFTFGKISNKVTMMKI